MTVYVQAHVMRTANFRFNNMLTKYSSILTSDSPVDYSNAPIKTSRNCYSDTMKRQPTNHACCEHLPIRAAHSGGGGGGGGGIKLKYLQ